MPKALQFDKKDIIVEEITKPSSVALWRGRGNVLTTSVGRGNGNNGGYTDYLCSPNGEINIRHLITFKGLNNLTITSFKLTYKLYNEYGELAKIVEFTKGDKHSSDETIEIDFSTLLVSYETKTKYQFESISALALTDVEVITDNGTFVYGDDVDPIIYSSKTVTREDIEESRRNSQTFLSKFKDFFTI